MAVFLVHENKFLLVPDNFDWFRKEYFILNWLKFNKLISPYCSN